MSIVIVNYGLGNLMSIQNMISYLGYDSVIGDDLDTITKADKLILPGVGAFDNGMQLIKKKNLLDVLNTKVLVHKVPVLGICLGMQLMCNNSEEGVSEGLSWINASVIQFNKEQVRVPHLGWNDVVVKKENPLLNKNELHSFYFVHSFHVKPTVDSDILCTTEYGNEFVSGFQKDNIYGVQFHPEKSHRFGMSLLNNFILNG